MLGLKYPPASMCLRRPEKVQRKTRAPGGARGVLKSIVKGEVHVGAVPQSSVSQGCAPSRDKQKVGMLQRLTTADGKTYGMFGPQENATK